MRRAVTVAAVAVVGASAAAAQATVKGTVRDSAGAVIVGADVTVQGVAKPATTNRTGDYQVDGVAAGTVVVSVRRLGYAPFSTIVRVTNGEIKVVDAVLTAVTRELDTVAVRDQQILRENPLLREFEEHKKIGLGQFVTREQLARLQGGFLSPVLNQMRGVVMVRSATVPSHTWIANSYVPPLSCFELEDRLPKETTSPYGAECKYCFPQVYLDNTRISGDTVIPNIGHFNPDQLQAMEVFLGPAETPARYSGNRSSCGVIVLHSRVPDPNRRVAVRDVVNPTRSRVFANVSASASTFTKGCADCGVGATKEGMLGYTFKDRWVVAGRYAQMSMFDGGQQTVTLRHVLLEWYPHPERGKYKWFMDGGLGGTWLALNTNTVDSTSSHVANGLPSYTVGGGIDIAVYRRFVVTPFLSHDRTVGGRAKTTRCGKNTSIGGVTSLRCQSIPSDPQVFSFTQLGVRFGWR